MKLVKKLITIFLVAIVSLSLSIAAPAASFARTATKAPVTARVKARTAKARLTTAKRVTVRARTTAAKRTTIRAKKTAARRTTAKARLTTAKRTTAKARMTAAKRTTAKARLTTARFRLTAAKAPAVKAGSRATVTAKALNVRSGPATTSKKVGTLRKGAVVKVVSTPKAGWHKVQYGTRTGYVSARYLK